MDGGCFAVALNLFALPGLLPAHMLVPATFFVFTVQSTVQYSTSFPLSLSFFFFFLSFSFSNLLLSILVSFLAGLAILVLIPPM